MILPAKEQIQQNVFTISNLQEIINLIKNEAEGERISNKRLLALLYKCVVWISVISLGKLAVKETLRW